MMTVAEKKAREINTNPKARVYAVPDDNGTYRLVPRPSVSQKRSFYQAAQFNRLNADWLSSERSANDQLKWSLRTLIARSRELENNNEYWDGFLKLLERNVVGPDGIQLRMQVYEPDGKGGWMVDAAAGSAIEDAWEEFNKPKNFLVTKNMSGVDAQLVNIRSTARDGAFLTRMITGDQAGNKFGFTLQLLEIDHLDPELNTTRNGNRVVMGVEIDKFQRPVAYWMLTDHPGDDSWVVGKKKYIRVPADEIIHPFKVMRIGQQRGFPWCASSMQALRMLGGYREAELVAAREGASQGGFFKDPDGVGNPYDKTNDESGVDPQSIRFREPGTAEYIGSLDFIPYHPNHPVQAYGDFVNEILRGFSTGLGVSHHNASGNMSGVNYSSARIAELAERDYWKLLQRWFSDVFLQPVFEEWLFHSLMRAAIKLPNGTPLPASKFDKFNQPTWRGRRWQWVDPAKEMAAAEKALSLKLTSRGRIITENMGADEEDVYQEIRRSGELLKAKGINEPQPEQPKPPAPPVDNEDTENDDDD